MTNSPPATHAKWVLSLGFILVSIAYAVWQNLGGSASVSVIAPRAPSSQSYKAASDALLQTVSQVTSSNSTTVPPASAPTKGMPSQPMTQSPMMQSGLYANGSYTGNAADAYYGTVQVKAVVKNGQLADVQFLQYPNDRSNSRYINGQAMPLLTQEAIQAQSAQVNGVSGATFTSQAFQQSLSSALALAKN